MCEWLSHGEWCDVKLLCGGRAFSAHRAVLASVSAFLRHLLLSCPTEETPTFIVLPDFDLDAMASVLYYIYNGEVVVKQEKIEMFLDIIKAMQIFVDNQYLPPTSSTLKSNNFNLSFHYQSDFSKRNIFTLGFEGCTDERFVNIRKGMDIQDVFQYSVRDPDCEDKLLRSQNPSGERESSLGNLKSPYGDRQRNSFLRDLFIETYPRNGNVNGLTAGVLAISNECYRAPASVLLTNANGKHLSADGSLLEPYKKTKEHISHSPTVLHLRKQQRCTRDGPHFGETKALHDQSCLKDCADEKNTKSAIFGADVNNILRNNIAMSANPLFQFGMQEQVLSRLFVPSLDFSVSSSVFDPMMQAHNNRSAIDNAGDKNSKEIAVTTSTRVTILNHVLDSPWSPRIPINYKPFRRKNELSMHTQVFKQKRNESNIINDSNNNVPKANSTLNLDTVSEPTPTADAKNTTASCVPQARRDDFKCTVCSQVFTSSEFLAVHMRRHSANARYSCGECGKTFSQLRNFKYHMSIHRGTREFAATCTVCGKYFNDRGYLSSHMKIHRNRKEYKCTLCPKSFNQRVAYNMHVRIHTGVKPHVCEECGKAFSRKMLLKQHQRTHSGERPYACPHCDKRFADRSNMTLHLRLHTGVKPFSCTLCPKSFTKKHHLKSHLNFHTGSKPYSCPRCKLAFTQSSNMRTHLKKCRAPEPVPGSELPQNSNNGDMTIQT
uniref:Protein krueppel n=1 Tax=Heliothis virescens TaxID=7102 RepID=A0A2A4J371_HELVI